MSYGSEISTDSSQTCMKGLVWFNFNAVSLLARLLQTRLCASAYTLEWKGSTLAQIVINGLKNRNKFGMIFRINIK